jgi:hypothetical protein
LVSTELRRRRFEDEASVRMDALSVRMLFAVAPWYELGCCCWGARCGGIAEGGGDAGNWCEKWTGVALEPVALFWFCAWPRLRIFEGAVDCIVVRVVVRECSEPLGDEKVLPPLTKLLPPVSAFDLDECTVSGTVATVGAVDLLLFSTPWRCPAAGSSMDV